MKIGWIIRLGALVVFLAGCSPAGVPPATQPPAIPSKTAASPTKSLAAVPPAASPVQPEPSATTELPTPPVSAGPKTISLVDLKISSSSTMHYRVVDAASGETRTDIIAHGESERSPIVAAGDSIYNLNSQTHAVRRVKPDGSIQELEFTNPTGQPFQGAFLPSPDGQRIAWSTLQSGASGEVQVQLKVARIDGSDEKTLLDEKRSAPTRPDPVRWSRDGKSLYYTNSPYGIGGYILFAGWTDLQKMDMTTGAVEEILPKRGCMCATALSPDESMLAYINRPEADSLELFIMDIAGGEKKKVRLPAGHMQAGDIVWSPDGSELLVSAAVGDPDQEKISIVKVNATTLEAVTLVTDDPRVPVTAAWPLASTAWLNDRNGDAWRMDPATGAMVQATQGEHVLPASE